MRTEEALMIMNEMLDIDFGDDSEDYEEALREAAKALKNEYKYRWHDLSYDATDLPETGVLVDCRTNDEQPAYYGYYDAEFGRWDDYEGFSMDVVAWREIKPL